MKCNKIFIAWSRLSNRTARLAQLLGLDLLFLRDRPPYLLALLKTFYMLARNKYDIVFVQLAPGPLLMLAAIMRRLKKYFLVADMHSFFLWPSSLRGALINRPFGFFLRFCDIIFVHGDIIKRMMHPSLRRKTIVVVDPPPSVSPETKKEISKDYFLTIFPASFAEDEPIEEIILAVKKLYAENYRIKLIVTGRYERRPELAKYSDGKTIIFTGYLPQKEYYDLLQKADIVAALTTVKYSMMAAALEAITLDKPLLISNQPVFKSLLGDYPLFVENTSEEIYRKLSFVIENKQMLEKLKTMIRRSKIRYIALFKATIRTLLRVIRKICKIKRNYA